MLNRLPALLFIAVAAFLQGCLTGDGDDPADKVDFPRPNVPVVTYLHEDSLTIIRIRANRLGEERFYWIYRDGKLLDAPTWTGVDASLPGNYTLVDSVQKPGTYAYSVRYGSHRDSLSAPSESHVFRYLGPSPSGRVYLSLTSAGSVEVHHSPGRKSKLRKVVIERKVGADGVSEALDTLETVPGGNSQYLDTALVLEDAYLFYRAEAMDIGEEWLEPSPWDSIRVENKEWTYLPAAALENQGTDIEVRVVNPLSGAGPVTYVLYRNDKSAKDGAEKVDSMVYNGSSSVLLADIPSEEGTYYYWTEARDSRGRVSYRSNPVATRYSGRTKGPSLTSLAAGSSYIVIDFQRSAAVQSYIIERAQDTTKTPVAVDTVSTLSGSITDLPPADGYWFYRVISVLTDDEVSEPGDWGRSGYFNYQPSFFQLTARISNRGDRIEATIPSPSTGLAYVLFRSAHPAGRDSQAVDTAYYNSFASVVPTLHDMPDTGTWYYRVEARRTETQSQEQYRSELTRVEFTGKPVGPDIQQITVQSTYVNIVYSGTADALAFVLERSPDAGSEWTPVDTMAARAGDNLTTSDRPPSNGFWKYRMRSFLKDLSLTAPGAARRTPTPWSDELAYSNTLAITLLNSGNQVEVSGIFQEFQTVFHLLRSAKGDYTGGMVVDTLPYSGAASPLTDAPAKGTYYYWVEKRYLQNGSFPNTIYRSVPIKAEITGVPEIASLVQEGNTVRIAIPRYPAGDTLEILRSSGKPDDAGSYAKVAESTGGFSSYYNDNSLEAGKSAFYHYRLVLIHEGKRSDMGGAKSIFFNPIGSGGGLL